MKKLLVGLVVLDICISISNHLKLKKIMSKEDQIKASIQELDDASNALAAKLQKAIDAEKDNVSSESLAALQSVADKLKALGSDPENPIPAVESTGSTATGTGDGSGAGTGNAEPALAGDLQP